MSGHGAAEATTLAIELEHRFGKDSPVRDYWLAASEGFEVRSADGCSMGKVRQVLHERDGKAVALVVESRRILRRTDELVLEADVVEEVAPWRSMLVVPPREAPEPAPRAARRRGRTVAIAAAAGRGVRVPAVVAVRSLRGRWPAARGGVAAGASASWRLVLSAAKRVGAAVRARRPSVQAAIRYAWAWIVAVVVGLAAALADHVARLVRALAARLAAARTPTR